MARIARSGRVALSAVLTLVLVVAIAALAGAASGSPSPQKQYSPPGKQYGKAKVTICHKGHTIKVAAPAVKAHLRHGDELGPC
jgi:hypothetical protein